MPPTTVREGLLRVLALIERGWTKGRSRKRRYDRDCYCISGAVEVAGKGLPWTFRNDMYSALRRALPTANWEKRGVIDFNDAKTTTKRAMLTVIKRAIEQAAA